MMLELKDISSIILGEEGEATAAEAPPQPQTLSSSSSSSSSSSLLSAKTMDDLLSKAKTSSVAVADDEEIIALKSAKDTKKREATESLEEASGEPQPKQRQKRDYWENETSRLSGHHFCVKLKGTKKQGGNGYIDNRGYCIFCQVKKVSYKCEQCKVFLCIMENQGSTCFSKFHTRARFTRDI